MIAGNLLLRGRGGNMSEDDQSSRRSSKRAGVERFAELGPAWIAALASLIVALTSAGFFAGRVSATPQIQPTKIITRTVAVTATPAVSSATPTTGITSRPGNYTPLGEYNFQLSDGDGAPLGPTRPTQSQITGSCASGISYDSGTSPAEFLPCSDEKFVTLPNGSTPSYSACIGLTAFVPHVVAKKGNAFCVIQNTGRVAGVTVTSVNDTPPYVTLKVSLWKGNS